MVYIREKSTSEFALIQDAQMSGTNNINLSTASLGDLNIGKLYSNTHILVGSDNSTGSIDISGGVLNLKASGIGNGFLSSEVQEIFPQKSYQVWIYLYHQI